MSSDPPQRHSTPRVVGTTILSTTLSWLPLFMLGSLVVFLRADLGFDERGLGISIAVFFAASAVASVPAGWLTQRLGARDAIRLSTATSAATLLAIALFARSWASLLVLLAVAGLSNGLAQPGANLALARGVAQRFQGLAFGVKQSAGTTASTLAGLAVPALALTLGWRWAMASAALLAIPVVLLMPRSLHVAAPRGTARRDGDPSLPPLIVLAVAGGAAAGAGTTTATFIVAYAVHTELGAGAAGLLLSAGGIIGTTARLIVGWLADRRGGDHHLTTVAALIAGGSLGYAVLGLSTSPALLLLGTAIVFAIGWSWPGLFIFAIVRTNPNAPAVATGIAQSGAFAGGVIVPFLFGTTVAAAGFRFAWIGLAGVAFCAAALMLISGWMLRRDLARMAAHAQPASGAGGA